MESLFISHFRYRIAILALVFNFNARAQADSILNISDKDLQLHAFYKWAYENIYWCGSETAVKRDESLAVLNKIYEGAQQAGNENLLREAWFNIELWKIGGTMIAFKPRNISAQKILKAAEVAHHRGWYYTEAQCRMTAAVIYFDISDFDPSFDEANKAYKIITESGLDKYPEGNLYIVDLANHYYHFLEYDSTVKFIRQAISVREPWASMPNLYNVLNTFAMAFEKLNQPDSAIFYYRKAYAAAQNVNNTYWIANVGGNLGHLYFHSGMDSLALPLLLSDFENNKRNNFRRGATKNADMLVSIFLHRGDVHAAMKYHEHFRHLMDTSDVARQAMLYRQLADISSAKKEFRMATIYLDSFLYYKKLDGVKYDKQIFTRSNQRVSTEGYASRIKIFEAEREKEDLIRNGMIGIIIIICLIAVMLVSRLQIKKNNAIKTAIIEKQLVQDYLDKYNIELNWFTKLLSGKNALIERFRKNIERLKMEEDEHEHTAILSQLSQANISTVSDWDEFRTSFDKVFPGFFNRLKEAEPGLTAADIRIIALTKLQISQKDMSVMLSISYDALRKAKQRLKAKMSLAEGVTIEDMVKDI